MRRTCSRSLTWAVFHLCIGDKHKYEIDLLHSSTQPDAVASASTPAVSPLGGCSTYQDHRAEGNPCSICCPDLDLREIAAARLQANFVSIGEGSTLHQQAPHFKSIEPRAKEGPGHVFSYSFVGA